MRKKLKDIEELIIAEKDSTIMTLRRQNEFLERRLENTAAQDSSASETPAESASEADTFMDII